MQEIGWWYPSTSLIEALTPDSFSHSDIDIVWCNFIFILKVLFRFGALSYKWIITSMFQLRIVVALIALGTLLAASALPIHGGSTDMLLNRRALPSPPPPQTRALDMAQCDTSLTDDSNPAWAALARALVERQRAGPLPPGQRGGVQGKYYIISDQVYAWLTTL